MYATCLHCTQPLGRNEAIAPFPVGRRLAFDAARGRLWVVCRACERWNLSPLEERWEAIEACERRFRETRVRVSTDQIGLARLAEGLELVRIGAPSRPEFAAWRYGDQFGRRRRRQLLASGAAVAAVGSLYVGGLTAGMSLGGFVWIGTRWVDTLIHGRPGAVVARVRAPDGRVLPIERRHARRSAILPPGADGAPRFLLAYGGGAVHLEGGDAERAARQLLPVLNRFGGTRRHVGEAVAAIAECGDARAFLRAVAADARDVRLPVGGGASGWGDDTPVVPGTLQGMDRVRRLALEMALHEEQERAALEGELAALREAWREAEEIAAIADGLFVPDAVEARLAALRAGLSDG